MNLTVHAAVCACWDDRRWYMFPWAKLCGVGTICRISLLGVIAMATAWATINTWVILQSTESLISSELTHRMHVCLLSFIEVWHITETYECLEITVLVLFITGFNYLTCELCIFVQTLQLIQMQVNGFFFFISCENI